MAGRKACNAGVAYQAGSSVAYRVVGGVASLAGSSAPLVVDGHLVGLVDVGLVGEEVLPALVPPDVVVGSLVASPVDRVGAYPVAAVLVAGELHLDAVQIHQVDQVVADPVGVGSTVTAAALATFVVAGVHCVALAVAVAAPFLAVVVAVPFLVDPEGDFVAELVALVDAEKVVLKPEKLTLKT